MHAASAGSFICLEKTASQNIGGANGATTECQCVVRRLGD